MGAQNFAFAHKFPENGGLVSQNFCIFERKFSDRLNLWEGGSIATSPCHDATGHGAYRVIEHAHHFFSTDGGVAR